MIRGSSNARSRRLRSLGVATTLAALTLPAASALAADPPNPVTLGSHSWSYSHTTVPNWGYQIAYSATNDKIWTTGTTQRFRSSGVPYAYRSTIQKHNATTGAIESTITPPTLDAGGANERKEAVYGLGVHDATNTLWVTSTREDKVVIYNQATGARIAEVPGIVHGRDVVFAGNYAYVSTPRDNKLYKISTAAPYSKRTISWTDYTSTMWQPDNLSPMSLATAGSALYSVNLSDGALLKFTNLTAALTTAPTVALGTTTAGVPGHEVSGVAVNATLNRAYTASQSSRELQTVDLATGNVTNTVTAGSAAEDSLLNVTVDPANGFTYSAVFGTMTAGSRGHEVLVTDGTGAKVGGGTINLGSGTDANKRQPNDVLVAKNAIWVLDRNLESDTGTGDGGRLWRFVKNP